MTDIKTETGKFTSAVKAEEVKASTWIGRHPGITLAIGMVQTILIVVLAFKAYG